MDSILLGLEKAVVMAILFLIGGPIDIIVSTVQFFW